MREFFVVSPRLDLSLLMGMFLTVLALGTYFDLFRARLVPFQLSLISCIFLTTLGLFAFENITPNLLFTLIAVFLTGLAVWKGAVGGADLIWIIPISVWFGAAVMFGIIPAMTIPLVLSMPLIWWQNNKRLRHAQVPMLPLLYVGIVIYIFYAQLLPLNMLWLVASHVVIILTLGIRERKTRPLPTVKNMHKLWGRGKAWSFTHEGGAVIGGSEAEVWRYPSSMFRIMVHDVLPEEALDHLLNEGEVAGRNVLDGEEYEIIASFHNKDLQWQHLELQISPADKSIMKSDGRENEPEEEHDE